MRQLLTHAQRAIQDDIEAFVASEVVPFAAQWEREQRIPQAMLASMGERGYLGCCVPREYGGQGLDAVTFGLLNEAFGSALSALTGVITVQAMVSMALLKWGTAEQKEEWLIPLVRGKSLASFALTEPGTGSDTKSLATRLTRSAEGFILNGTKKWISCGQFAGVFLVFGMLEERSAACLVPKDACGVSVEPISELMGFRSAGLAQVRFQDVAVPAANLLGKPGFGLSHVAGVSLHYGRLSTACSALGLLRGCLEQSIAHAAARKIGDRTVGKTELARSSIARMGTDLAAAALLCHSACRAEDERLPQAFEATLMAKYFASRAAVRAASDAVQIFGASGCHESSAVSRYYRDSKIMEIIEGTTQIHEQLLGKMFIDRAAKPVHVDRSERIAHAG